MSCEHDCARPPEFPKAIDNRPGLDLIGYRIGSYADMRAHMLALLDREPALARFTHRRADDPAIALIEGAAIVGDILSFYQQLYANEAYLRTARWRDSVADLVKLLGYRLAPGLGGHARFALAAKGERPILVPQGFAIKAELDGAAKPAVFETSAPATAHPHLSQFALYRPRHTPAIVNGVDSFAIVAAAPAGLKLKAGDRVMVGVGRSDGLSLDHSQILVVDEAWDSFGTGYVRMKGGIASLAASGLAILSPPNSIGSSSVTPFSLSGSPAIAALLGAGLGVATIPAAAELRAYKLAGSFRHFGHNAPAQQITVAANGRAQSAAVSYQRNLATTTHAPASPALSALQMPLDGQADAMVAGATLLVEANLSPATGAARKRIIERAIHATDRQSLAWGPMTGASTVMTLDRSLALTEGGVTLDRADIRGMTFHQVEGAAFALRAMPQPIPAAAGNALDFFGTAAEAATLERRTLLLAGPGEALGEANVLAVAAGADATPAFHRVTLDRAVAYADFDHDRPTVAVFGNLVAATEGKSEAETALGDGDARAVFQTFALPKPPLTYLSDPGQDPPQAPELQVFVGGRLWRRVDVLFGSGPRDGVYVVREDAAGNSFLQFGDGKSGARLPSGRGNVVAAWRSGVGSHGPLKPDAAPQAAARLAGLDKILMPEPVTGGAAPESEDGARIAAPGRMQSLARLVSLADFEAEALAIAGVLKARAQLSVADGTPQVVVTLLTASRSAADAAAAARSLLALYRSRGPARYPVLVRQGTQRLVRIAATVGHDPTRRADDVAAAIRDALGAAAEDGARDHGLFSWQRRQFGQAAHGSHIVAAIQNVPGVVWVELTAAAFKTLPLSQPASPPLPTPRVGLPPARRTLPCPDDRILALDAADLTVGLVPADASEVP